MKTRRTCKEKLLAVLLALAMLLPAVPNLGMVDTAEAASAYTLHEACLLYTSIQFEWDEEKERKNINKHSCSKVNSMLFYVLALFFFIPFKLNHILPFQYTKLQYIMQYIL